MKYWKALVALKESFLGGSERSIIAQAISNQFHSDSVSLFDIGIGDGAFLSKMLGSISNQSLTFDITGLDPSAESLAQAADKLRHAHLKCGRFETYTHKEKYDAILATQSLYYMDDPKRSILRMFDMAQSRGIVIITVWSTNCDLYKIHNSIWGPMHSVETNAEAVKMRLSECAAVSKVILRYYEGSVSFLAWKNSEEMLEGAGEIISRKPISQDLTNRELEQLRNKIAMMPDLGRRVNGVVIGYLK